MRSVLIVASVFLIGACASVKLSEAGRNVKVVETIPSHCESLGLIAGEGGSSWTGGAYYKNATLIEYAQNDLKNKAAELGATHIIIKTTNLGETHGQYGGTVTGANLTGTAYRCNSGAASKK
jgi:hypothetical protein